MTDTTVTISKEVAAKVAQDLIELDYLREKSSTDSLKLAIFGDQIDVLDSIIDQKDNALRIHLEINLVHRKREAQYQSQQQQYKRRINRLTLERNFTALVGTTAIIILLLL